MKYYCKTLFSSIFILLFVLLLACDNTTDEKQETPPSNMLTNKAKVYDINNNFVGYLLEMGLQSFKILTNNHYMVSVRWDGTITGRISYTEQDGGGDPYYTLDNNLTTYGKFVVFNSLNNKYYTSNVLNADGTTVVSQNITIQSEILTDDAGNAYYENFPSTTEDFAILLKTTTRSVVGLPDTITPPFTYDFGE